MIDIGNNTVYLGGALPEEKGTSNGGLELLDTLENFNLNFISGGVTPEEWATVYGPSPLLLSKAKANGLGYVKAFGGTEQRNLPSEYTQVEYLESSGTQYIDTGITATNNTGLKVVYEYTDTGSAAVAGVYQGTNPRTDTLFISTTTGSLGSSLFCAHRGATSDAVTFPTSTVNTKYTGEINYLNSGYMGFGSDVSIAVGSNNTYNHSIPLFARYNVSGNNYAISNSKIYSAVFTEDNTISHDFVPARRNSDNVLGMYDTVTGNFLTNAGTGTFTAGPDAVPTPDTPMDIVSNNGVLKYGYKSVNMFDKDSTLEDGEIWGPNGATQLLPNYYGTNQIHVIGGHTYTRSGSHGSANYIKLSDGTWINQSDSSATITMPDNAVLWVFNNTTATSRDTMMVVEGTSLPAEYVPYKGYGIYTDGTVETINVHTKNLFDENDVILGHFYDDSGSYETNSNTFTSGKIPMNAGTTVTFSRSQQVNNVYLRIHAFNSSNNWIGLVAKSTSAQWLSCEGTTPANTSYIRVCGAKRGEDEIDYECQVEQGSTATSYTPYFNGGTATAEMLLKVGDYKDEQSVLDGAITRNIGVKVLDGTEDWSITDDDCFSSSISDKLSGIGIIPISTHFKSAPNTGTSSVPDNGIGASSNIANKQVWIKMTSISSVDNFKVYLADQYNAGTPVIVIYPLATPTTESVSGQTLNTTSGDNVLEITQASIDGLEIEAKYKKTK